MATVGKKKKVYIVRKEKGNGKLLLLGGAAIAAYFLLHQTSSTTTEQTTVPDSSGGGLSHNDNPVIVDSGSGNGTQVIQPTPVTVTPGTNQSSVNSVAASDRAALLRESDIGPVFKAALNSMTSQEIIDTYNYFYSFFLYGKQLYRYPDPAHPGDWNTNLYDAIQVIRAKYKIF